VAQLALALDSGSTTFILNQLIEEQLVKPIDLYSKPLSQTIQLLQRSRIVADQQLGSTTLGILQPGQGELLSDIRSGELERSAADWVAALAPPEQLPRGTWHDRGQQLPWCLMAFG
jgi:hypothetical protein